MSKLSDTLESECSVPMGRRMVLPFYYVDYKHLAISYSSALLVASYNHDGLETLARIQDVVSVCN